MDEMGVGQENVRSDRPAVRQVVAQFAQPGTRIEDQPTATTGNFNATRIPAERNMLRRGSGYTAPHAPELDFETHGPRPSAPPLPANP